MILKTCFLLVVSVVWKVSGASYSNVFFQTGPDAARSVEYLPSSYNPLAQYNAAPVSYEYPFGQSYSYRTGCPSGACVYPEPTIASLAPAAPSANVLTYSTPVQSNIPYTYGINDPASSYSYVLVNPSAGQDLKLSDGEVIRGGYTFVQPEGLVQYVADDNQGLNAIFKAYIPTDAHSGAQAHTETVVHEKAHHEPVHHAEPCREAKSEALTAHEHHGEGHIEHNGGHEHTENHEEHGKEHDEHEARHGNHEEKQSQDIEIILSPDKSDSEENEHGEHEEHITRTRIIIHEEKGESKSESESEEDKESEEEEHSHKTEHEHKPEHHVPEHHVPEHHVPEHHVSEHHEEHVSHHEHHTHEPIVEIIHEPYEKHEHHKDPVAHVAPQVPALAGNNVNVYDIIKCIQAAMARGNPHPFYNPAYVPTPTSPLTYLVLNKPC